MSYGGATPAGRSLQLALFQIGLAGLALAGAEIAIFYTQPPELRWLFVLFVAVGLLYLGAGLLAWARRPSNRTGALICLCGFGLIAGAAVNTNIPWLVGPAIMVASVPIAVLIQLLLAFPSGRLPDRASRVVCRAHDHREGRRPAHLAHL